MSAPSLHLTATSASAAFDPGSIGNPRAELRTGAAIIAVFALGLFGWAAVTRVDAAVHSSGVISVAGRRQTVQSANGGIVSSIRVKDGDRVRQGDVLIAFAGADLLAQERSLANRVFGLQAEIARIAAQQSGRRDIIAAPVEWAAFDDGDRALAVRALANEQINLASAAALLRAQRAVLGQRLAEVSDQIGGYAKRRGALAEQQRLNRQELDVTQRLFDQGYATKSRVLALQSSAAGAVGDIGSVDAEIARLRSSAGEVRMQMVQLASERQQHDTDRMPAAQTELQSLLPQWKAAREQLDHAAVRAPVTGTVMGLALNTLGGVVPAGARLLDIVPAQGSSEVATTFPIDEGNDVHDGQAVIVHVRSSGGGTLPELHGTVRHVSADSFAEERGEQPHYSATIAVSDRELASVARQAGFASSFRSGTPVDVVVPLKKRTALEFLLGPLTQRLSGAMSEH